MPDTEPTAPAITVAGGGNLSRADIDRLFADSPAVRAALRAQADAADAARTPAPEAAAKTPCCAECAEAEAAKALAAAAQAFEDAEHARALASAESEGLPAENGGLSA